MSKTILAALGMVLIAAGAGYAADDYQVYSYGSGSSYAAMSDPYSGPTPSGMRFGDVPHTTTVLTADGADGYAGFGCPNCGVLAPPCDPCWKGPCMDWKLIGWYSNFRDKQGHGCRRCGRCATCIP